jgi:hypothetical protein
MPLKLLTLSWVPTGCAMFWLTPGPVTTPPGAPLGVCGAYCPADDEYASTCPFAGVLEATGTL